MYKRILCCLLVTLCMVTTSFSQSSKALHTSIYLDETVYLESIFASQDIDFPLDDHTSIQNVTPQLITCHNNFAISANAIGTGVIILEHGSDFLTLNLDITSPIASIETATKDLTLLLGEIAELDYTVIAKSDYNRPVNQTLEWVSSNLRVATVKGSQLISTEAAGHTTLTGTSLDGSQQIVIELTVQSIIDGVTIEAPLNATSIDAGEQRQLKAFLGSKDVTNTITWKSEAPSIISVDKNGVITAHQEGTCAITAQSTVAHKKDSYTFFVKSRVDRIELDHSSIIFEKIGQTATLNATITPQSMDKLPLLEGYTYTSSNENIAIVNQDGMVTATGEGIALITVVSNDSLKKDYCTVEILSDVKITTTDYIPVTEITAESIDYPVLIGQKIPLTYEILPSNATDQTIDFKVSKGNNAQVQLIEGRYYFIPQQRGNIDIKLLGENESEALIEVNVVSPLSNLELSLDNNRTGSNEHKLYTGERVELLTTMKTNGYYSDYDVYPNTLEYTVDDDRILKLETLNGKHYITALKQGTCSVSVNNIEDRYTDTIKVEIDAPTKLISTNREVELPLNLAYRPEVKADTTLGLTSVEDFCIDRAIELKMEGYFLTEDFIDEEIRYENFILNELNSTPVSADVSASIAFHNTRLKNLEKLKSDVYRGYTRTFTSNLKDRNGSVYQYYDIKNHTITGLMPGKAVISLTLKGTARKAVSTLYFKESTSAFNIKKSTAWLPLSQLIESSNLEEVLSNFTLNDKIKHYIFYNNHKEWFSDLPSQKLLTAMVRFYNPALPENIFSETNNYTTKSELAYVGLYLADFYQTTTDVNINHIIYYDITDDDIRRATALGYIEPASFNYLGVSDTVNSYDLLNMLNKINPNHTLTFEPSLQPLSHKDLILILSQL